MVVCKALDHVCGIIHPCTYKGECETCPIFIEIVNNK